MTLHNPEHISPATAELHKGYRFLNADELRDRINPNKAIEFLVSGHWYGPCYGTADDITYRTRLSVADLLLSDQLNEAGPAH